MQKNEEKWGGGATKGSPAKGIVEYPEIKEPRENQQAQLEGRDPSAEHLEGTIPLVRNPAGSLSGAFQHPPSSDLQLSRSTVTQSCAGSSEEGRGF